MQSRTCRAHRVRNRVVVEHTQQTLSAKNAQWKLAYSTALRFEATRPPIASPKIRRPNGYWLRKEHQQRFFDAVGQELGVVELSDWYRIPRKEVLARGGKFLLSLFPSFARALMAAYPEYPWQISKFVDARNPPYGFWQEDRNILSFFPRIEEKLGIQQPKDWYNVTMTDLKTIGMPVRFSKLKLIQLLSQRYPEHKWDTLYMWRGKYAQQKRLEHTLIALFPDVDVSINAKKEPRLINPSTGDYLELDIYFPSLQLAFEYQERHHFVGSHYIHEPLEALQARDKMKIQLAKSKGITLIQIPCWWDGHKDSLIATIKSIRPDIALPQSNSKAKPISLEMPEDFVKRQSESYVTDIGQPITACFLTTMSTDPTNWWMFEKYDGLRAFWNPTKKAFYSRLGNQFDIPAEITQQMPSDIFLDGEFWFGRDTFPEATKISNRADSSTIDWTRFKYMVFDSPLHKGTYAERYAYLENSLQSKEGQFIQIAPKDICQGMQHLEQYFQETINQGGEGIILRDPNSPNIPGRSPGYLKHKKFRDAEAKIVAQVGPHWECILPNGVTFTAAPGSKEFLKTWAPKPDDIVSFRHSGFFAGSKRPKFPLLYRLRPDLSWESVVSNWNDQTESSGSAMALIKRFRDTTTTRKRKGYWRDPENRKQLFTKFAHNTGFDPLIAENWTNAVLSQLSQTKEAKILISRYGDIRTPLREAFPDLKFNLPTVKYPNHYWKDLKNVRQFFDEIAKEREKDPTNPRSWESIRKKDILKKVGGWSITEEHKGYRSALKLAYPEVSFAW